MKQISRSALVSFSAEQMFDLVNDVSKYPEFLPGCSGSRIIESSDDGMVASVDVAKQVSVRHLQPLTRLFRVKRS